MQPQDKDSGLVKREWRRTHPVGGVFTERTLEGEKVTATFPNTPGDLFGGLRRVAGTVCRNDAGELVVEAGPRASAKKPPSPATPAWT